MNLTVNKTISAILYTITINGHTYYDSSSILLMRVFGGILLAVGLIMLISEKKKPTLTQKYSDTELFNDDISQNTDGDMIDDEDISDEARANAVRTKISDKEFEQMLDREDIDESVNDDEYETDSYVYGGGIRAIAVIFTVLPILIGAAIMIFSFVCDTDNDYKEQERDGFIIVTGQNSSADSK
ncbi:MAG: hypothetical protein K6F91_10585 [Ruminococcus sp.]|nr:hypothetical protein [Ruminococcus sp.]